MRGRPQVICFPTCLKREQHCSVPSATAYADFDAAFVSESNSHADAPKQTSVDNDAVAMCRL